MKHFFILIFISGLFSACTADKNGDPLLGAVLFLGSRPIVMNSGANTKSRSDVILDYNKNYLSSTVLNPEWTGNVAGCIAGTTSQNSDDLTLKRINYFRRQISLPSVAFNSASYGVMAQEAALMMKANNKLSHTPDTTWTCHTPEGEAGAGKSNLYLGVHSSPAVTGYIDDPGPGNGAAGHRRWILYSKALTMESGSTDSSNALLVITPFAAAYPDGMHSFHSWPPEGYVARQLVFPRWSFSVPGADMSSASVTMTDSSQSPVSLTMETYAQGYGDNTIVWVPSGINTSSSADQTYSIQVSNVLIGGVANAFQYTVTLVDPGENGFATAVPNADWNSTAGMVAYQAEGQRFIFNCPPGGTANSVWGSNEYFSSSSVCSAAVHAGKISPVSGGSVTIVIRPLRSGYSGTSANGITTLSYTSAGFGQSFIFQ